MEIRAREKTLEERVMEYLEALKGQELMVRDMARALKVDEKRLRRALRKIRAENDDLIWAKVKGRLVYIYCPTEEQRARLERIKTRANNRPVVRVEEEGEEIAEEITEETAEETAEKIAEEIAEDIGEVTLTAAE